MVSPDSQATACPSSGRNSTYRPVQISGASSPNPVRLQRLSKRGFIKTHEDDKLQVTMKGRAALLFGRRWGAPGH
jgi:hypothetical protein